VTIDKSNDWMYQVSTVTIWYLAKVEGNVISSISEFKVSATQIDNVKTNLTSLVSPHFLQNEEAVFHLWRAKCPEGFLPHVSDRILIGNAFFVVNSIKYCDRDDSGFYQRYRLTCTGSNVDVSP
jgi:hypothetical protein